jgi:hypothetical protein
LFESNSNDAVVACESPDGPLKIAATGGSLSTVQRPEPTKADSFPAASVAKTKA